MKHKRLNRALWGFQHYPYYQMRLDCDVFRGIACLIRLTDCESNYWSMPKAGRVQITGSGMTWLELIPDGTHRVITVKYFPDGTYDAERQQYPIPQGTKYMPSVWYVDVTDGIYTDTDGVVTYIDKFLDVIFTPEGDIKVDDRDELEDAYANGTITRAQYEDALEECSRILSDLCTDIVKTGEWCATIRDLLENACRST